MKIVDLRIPADAVLMLANAHIAAVERELGRQMSYSKLKGMNKYFKNGELKSVKEIICDGELDHYVNKGQTDLCLHLKYGLDRKSLSGC